jgi:hypothetical protein
MVAGRTAWGATYTHCRMLIVALIGYATDAPIPMRKLLLRWVIALPYLMRSHLMDYKPGCDSLEHLLTDTEVRCTSCTALSFILSEVVSLQNTCSMTLSCAQELPPDVLSKTLYISCSICMHIACCNSKMDQSEWLEVLRHATSALQGWCQVLVSTWLFAA